MGVQGAQRLGAPERCSSEQAHWCLFGFFLGIQKEARPAGRNPVRRRAGSSRPTEGAKTKWGRRGHTPGWLLSAFGRFTFSPRPTIEPPPSSAPFGGTFPQGKAINISTTIKPTL